MSGDPISSLSKKQAVVTMSTSVAEYVTLSLAVQEAVQLRRLLKDIQDLQNEPITIIEDNQGGIGITKNPVAHSKTKHIDIKYYYTREAVRDGTVILSYWLTKMIADILTKPLPKQQFEILCAAMGLELIRFKHQPNN